MRTFHGLIILLLLLAPAFATPRGEFLFGESDGEDFVFRAHFEGETVRLQPLSGGPDITSALTELRGGVYGFNVDWDGKKHQMTLVEIDHTELLLVSDKEKEALKGWKVSSESSILQGRWSEEGRDGHSFTMDGQEMKLLDNGKSKEVRVYHLKSSGKTMRMILMDPGELSKDGILLNYVQVDDNSVLMWDLDDGDTKLFHRSGWAK